MNRKQRRPWKYGCALPVITAVIATVGCGGKAKPPAAASAPRPSQPVAITPTTQPRPRPTVARRGTLYERIGGESVIRAVVDDFVTRAASDPAVNFSRQGHDRGWQATPENVDRLKQHMVEFLATAAGGALQYNGRDMVTVHKGMGITGAEFDALAADLGAALEANHVPRREREELLATVASTRGAIVEVASPPAAVAPRDPDSKPDQSKPDEPKPVEPKPEPPKSDEPKTEASGPPAAEDSR